MSVRAIQARIECDRQTFESPWRTDRVFNERVPGILSWLFKMRQGEWSQTPCIRHTMEVFATRAVRLCRGEHHGD